MDIKFLHILQTKYKSILKYPFIFPIRILIHIVFGNQRKQLNFLESCRLFLNFLSSPLDLLLTNLWSKCPPSWIKWKMAGLMILRIQFLFFVSCGYRVVTLQLVVGEGLSTSFLLSVLTAWLYGLTFFSESFHIVCVQEFLLLFQILNHELLSKADCFFLFSFMLIMIINLFLMIYLKFYQFLYFILF